MSDLKVGFVVNTKYVKDGNLAQQLHLLIIRILLYHCYSLRTNVTWGYHLFRSGRLNISYKRISLQTIAIKPSQKLLSDLIINISDPCISKGTQSGRKSLEFQSNGVEDSDLLTTLDEEAQKEIDLINGSWEEALTVVASDFNWDDDTENVLFVLSSSLIGDSDRVRAILSSLQKDKKVKLVMVDTNALEGSRSHIDQDMLDTIVNGRYSRQHTSVIIPTDLLCSDISKFCFRQIFLSHLTNKTNSTLQTVKFIATETILILDDSSEKFPVVDDGDMIFTLSPVESGMGFTTQFVSLKFKMEVSYAFAERYLDHNSCYFVVFDEQFKDFTTHDLPSFSVESVEVVEDKKEHKTYIIKHLTPHVGVMFSLLELADPTDLAQLPRTPEEESFDLLSFHDLVVNENSGSLYRDVSRQFRLSLSENCLINNTSEDTDSHMMEQLKNFHDLHINDTFATRLTSKPDTENESKEDAEVRETLSTIPEVTAESASEEAMLQSFPRYVERANITALVRKHQNDVKQELLSPSKLKEKHSNSDKLIKEHKIQVVLHLVWYSEFSDMDAEEKERAASGVLALLRSLSFLTSPTQMFSFLNDQILEDFHEDCQELLRELYEDGFLMEVPDILCEDSNSLSSSILSTHHVQAPLYCEDTSNSQSNDAPSASQSTFSRHRSWMDPCQSSQSSFSISIPKHKKKKKKHRDFNGKTREDSNKIAAKVCSKKQAGGETGRSKYLSSEVTPDEVKQSSKRRKFSRKNSVLDTPLKKQVKNPTTAKSSRARQRVEVTPQKCTSVSQIQESPLRGSSGRASSFFGSQAQPKALKTFAIKDGFKTPNIPVFNLKTTPSSSTEDIPSLFRSPDQVSQSFTPPRDYTSQNSNSQTSQHSFTPPGTPRSGRKFVKKLSYNSPMRALFVTGSNHIPSPKRTPLDSDYIQMKVSPSRSLMEKENEPFFPSLRHFDNSSDPKQPCNTDSLHNTLEPIIHPRLNEDAQMPTFQSSPYQGTINLQSKGGFLKLLEESNSMSNWNERKRDSDNESDVSAASVSSYKSILKSPFTVRRKKRSVSFSLDLETPFSSDTESDVTGSKDFSSLLNLVDGSIKSDEMVGNLADNSFGCEPLSEHSNSRPETISEHSNPRSEPLSRDGIVLQSGEQSSVMDSSSFTVIDNLDSSETEQAESRKRKRSESPT